MLKASWSRGHLAGDRVGGSSGGAKVPLQSPPWSCCPEPACGRPGSHLLEVSSLSPPTHPAILIPPTYLALSPSRFKYVLVNMSTGLVQDQSLWSDPVRTNRRKWWGWAGGVWGWGWGFSGNLGM